MYLSGDVFGWYTVPRDCDESWGVIDIEEAIALSDEDIYFPNYDRIILISDDRSCGIRFGGSGTIGKWELESDDGPFRASVAKVGDAEYFFNQLPLPSGGERSYSWTAGDWLITHEFGHNLGTGLPIRMGQRLRWSSVLLKIVQRVTPNTLIMYNISCFL